jgi:hypothetical protein
MRETYELMCTYRAVSADQFDLSDLGERDAYGAR